MAINNSSCKYFGGSKVLSSYLNDIRKYKVPTSDEEVELFERIKNGDESAKVEIVERNQRFVYGYAKIYAKDEDEVLDYVNEGNIGLLEAIDYFDVTRGFKFITFAVRYIKREMNYYFTTTNNIVKRPNNMRIGKKIDKVKQQFFALNGYNPSDDIVIEEIEKNFGIHIKENTDVMDVNVNSICDKIDEDGATIEEETIYTERTSSINEYEECIEKDHNNEVIKDVFGSLNLQSENAEILKMLFGIGYDREYTISEIGAKFDLDDETVINIKNKTLAYLRQEVKVGKIAI